MLPIADLRAIATGRLDDARSLLAAGRFDWAFYTAGYAVECAPKARIAATLGSSGFPATAREFERFKSFKTHNLNTLLALSGMEQQIMANHSVEWSEVEPWDPEQRYNMVGSLTVRAAQVMVDSSARLVAAL